MWESRRRWLGKFALLTCLVAATVLATLASVATFGMPGQANAPTVNAAADGSLVATQTGKAAAGLHMKVNLTSKMPAPLAGERQREQAGVNLLQNLQPAPVGPITKPSTRIAGQLGPQAAKPSSSSKIGVKTTGAPLADSDFDIEQTNTVSSGVCPTGCQTSAIMEPSIANDGYAMMESGNWFDTVSYDAGNSWGYIDPYTEFSAGTPNEFFCCDQQVLYEPARNTMYWESLFLGNTLSDPNSIVLADSAGTDLSSWCYWNITPSWFNLPNTYLLDYPDIQYSTSNLFLTFNTYTSQSETAPWQDTYVVRMPLDSLSTCSTVSYSWITTGGNNFSVALTSNAQGTMWFDSNWYTSGPGTGSSVRIWAWQDPQSSPTVRDRTVTAWNWTGRGQNCASADLVVTNWCGRMDSRRGSLYLTKANYKGTGPSSLGMAWSAGAGNGFPYPYIQREYFNLAGFTYDYGDQVWATWGAFAYPSFTSNYAGFIGGSFAWGGGCSGCSDYYPSTAYLLDDGFNPNPPWPTYYVFGNGNASVWGDYNTTREFVPQGYQFIAGGWYVDGGVVPFEVVFGRGVYHYDYLRWYFS